MVTVMFVGSFIIGYWITSAALVDTPDHIRNSYTKVYLALYMALWMVALEIVSYSYMTGKYETLWWLIPTFGCICFVYCLLRKQEFINELEYMKAMIQHHSSAVLTSKQILKKNPSSEVKQLAESIIQSQEKEIDVMNQISQN